ncbi:CBS domain-containing protein [Actinomadura roseirufa]|uniref:CBS domain-containing protein n=1 Tax=Actinomadura roseirufa TaxID=2094049 RepID=UPI001041AB6D|nr:CBS domain-containing protein [Actinomadura roseirufa]
MKHHDHHDPDDRAQDVPQVSEVPPAAGLEGSAGLLLGETLDLVDRATADLTPDDIEDRLRRILAGGRQDTEAEDRQAQDQVEAAKDEATRIVAEAHRRAAEIVAAAHRRTAPESDDTLPDPASPTPETGTVLGGRPTGLEARTLVVEYSENPGLRLPSPAMVLAVTSSSLATWDLRTPLFDPAELAVPNEDTWQSSIHTTRVIRLLNSCSSAQEWIHLWRKIRAAEAQGDAKKWTLVHPTGSGESWLLGSRRGFLDPCRTVPVVGARSSARDIGAQSAVGARVAADVLVPYEVPLLEPGRRVDQAVEAMIGEGEHALPVHDGEAVIGVVTLADAVAAARGRPGDPVSTILRRPTVTGTGTPIDTVRDQILTDSAGLLVVLDEAGVIAGYITARTALAGHVGPGGDRPPGNGRAADLYDPMALFTR